MKNTQAPMTDQKHSPATYRKWMQAEPRQAQVYLDMVNQGRHDEARDLRDIWIDDWKNPRTRISSSASTSQRVELREAISYFFEAGFIDELTSDKQYYAKVLLDHAAKEFNLKLDWNS